MIRKLCAAFAVAFLIISLITSTFVGGSLSAIAATQEYTQTESKPYPSQPAYDKKQESSDDSYKDKQKNQKKPQEKTNQTDSGQKQYAQQEQSYQEK